MSFCDPRGDVEQEKKSTDKGERLHVCDCEQPESFVSHGGADFGLLRASTIPPGGLYAH